MPCDSNQSMISFAAPVSLTSVPPHDLHAPVRRLHARGLMLGVVERVVIGADALDRLRVELRHVVACASVARVPELPRDVLSHGPAGALPQHGIEARTLSPGKDGALPAPPVVEGDDHLDQRHRINEQLRIRLPLLWIRPPHHGPRILGQTGREARDLVDVEIEVRARHRAVRVERRRADAAERAAGRRAPGLEVDHHVGHATWFPSAILSIASAIRPMSTAIPVMTLDMASATSLSFSGSCSAIASFIRSRSLSISFLFIAMDTPSLSRMRRCSASAWLAWRRRTTRGARRRGCPLTSRTTCAPRSPS